MLQADAVNGRFYCRVEYFHDDNQQQAAYQHGSLYPILAEYKGKGDEDAKRIDFLSEGNLLPSSDKTGQRPTQGFTEMAFRCFLRVGHDQGVS